VDRADLTELQYIVPLSNLDSIFQYGILCHRVAQRIAHDSIAMAEVQDLRTRVVVPGGRPLHDYVNLYICARNPMMYKRRTQYAALCVLSIKPDVLDLPEVVITDGNAASEYTRFEASPNGLAKVDKDLTFAEWWTHDDYHEKLRRKRAKCAEVLVPGRIAPDMIFGIHVAQALNHDLGFDIPISITPKLFFR
jgi:hypothetical protein